jgi:phosphoribosylformimino-5-aminoimidazole carboxamide ribonucleotide (ProFAR) isomerase
MLLVFPEIKIRNGESVYSIQGEPGTEEFYNQLQKNPFQLCKLLRTENSKSIVLTDLDGLEQGQVINFDVICMLTPSTNLPIQVLSGFGSHLECEFLLDFGVQMIYLTHLPLIQTDAVVNLIKKYSYSQIGFYINDSDGLINFHNLKKVMPVKEYIEFIYSLGGKRFYYENQSWINDKSSVDYDYLTELAIKPDIKFNVANAVENVSDLWKIAQYEKKGIGSAIICEPLFFNHFACQKVWRLAEADSIKNNNIFTLQSEDNTPL